MYFKKNKEFQTENDYWTSVLGKMGVNIINKVSTYPPIKTFSFHFLKPRYRASYSINSPGSRIL